MNEYANQAQIDWMKNTMLTHQLFTGDYDRLWKILEAHEIDVRTPGDGTRMTAETADRTIGWLQRQVAKIEQASNRERIQQNTQAARDRLQQAVKVSNPADVPAGTYTINGHTWQVDRPATGKWAGHVFVSEVVNGHTSPDTRLNGKAKWDALRLIVSSL